MINFVISRLAMLFIGKGDKTEIVPLDLIIDRLFLILTAFAFAILLADFFLYFVLAFLPPLLPIFFNKI